jgi:hypothetical protein
MQAERSKTWRGPLAVAALLALMVLAVSAAAPGGKIAPTGGLAGDPTGAVRDLTRNAQRTPDCPLAEHTPFGPGNWPSGCWRPYSDDSPFNRPIGPDPHVMPESDRVVARLLGFGPLQHMLVGEAGKERDHSHPTYYSQADDPWFTLHCLKRWDRPCPLEGARIQIPDEALIPTGSDGHMTVVDQRGGWEYDFWQVRSKPKGGGLLTFSWGDRGRLDGDGLGVEGNAAFFGERAGLIRAEELEAGRIDHALFIFVNCDAGYAVYPAQALGRACEQIGLPNEDAPPEGARFQLAMSYDEIEALDVAVWQKPILHAMAEYGMFVGDTGGTWGLKLEGGITYTSFGYPDRFVRYAQSVGAPYSERGQRYVMNLRDGVDWAGRLRLIDPCESAGTC